MILSWQAPNYLFVEKLLAFMLRIYSFSILNGEQHKNNQSSHYRNMERSINEAHAPIINLKVGMLLFHDVLQYFVSSYFKHVTFKQRIA